MKNADIVGKARKRSLRVVWLSRLRLHAKSARTVLDVNEKLFGLCQQPEIVQDVFSRVTIEEKAIMHGIKSLLEEPPTSGLHFLSISSLAVLLNAAASCFNVNPIHGQASTISEDIIDRARNLDESGTELSIQEAHLIELMQSVHEHDAETIAVQMRTCCRIYDETIQRLETLHGHRILPMPPSHNLLLLTEGKALLPLASSCPHLMGEVDMLGRSLLHVALDLGAGTNFQAACLFDASITSIDLFGRSPLHIACSSGPGSSTATRHEAIVQLLLGKGADIELRDVHGRTPLSYATSKGDEVIVRLLLDNGADIESEDDHGRTPLSYAVSKGHKVIIQLLLDSRADFKSLLIHNGLFPFLSPERGHAVNEFRDVIGPIVLLADPLSVSSLAQLLDIAPEVVVHTLKFLRSVIDIPSKPDDPIRILNMSFRDFLVDPAKRTTNEFWVDEIQYHERIANSCLRLMSSGCLKRDICNLKKAGKPRIEAIDISLPAHVRYACLYWAHHFQQSKGRLRDGDQVYSFLKRHFLHWLEALSLMGEVFKSIAIINTLRTLVEAEMSSEVSAFLYDAERFILSCVSIVDISPLQLYCSAIAFAPGKSIIRSIFQDEASSFMTLLPKVGVEWTACRQTLEAHGDCVTSVALSPDSRLLASASSSGIWSNGILKIWDAYTGQSLQTLEGVYGNSITFLNDSGFLASSSEFGEINIWHIATGQCWHTLKGNDDDIPSIISHDSRFLASVTEDSVIEIWDSSTRQCRQLKDHNHWISVTFSHDSRLIASASSDNTVMIWDVATGQCLQTLNGHHKTIRAVAFSHDSQRIASASRDKTIKIWDIATGQCRQTLEGPQTLEDYIGDVGMFTYLYDSKFIVLALSKEINIWDAATDQWGQTFTEVLSRSVAISHDLTLLAFASAEIILGIWDATTGQCRQMLGDLPACMIAFSHDSRLLASSPEIGEINIWHIATGQCWQTLKGHSYNHYITSIIFSHDSRFLASASEDGIIKIWDIPIRQDHRSFEAHEDHENHSLAVDSVAFSYDSRLLATTSESDNTVMIWDVATGQCRHTFKHVDFTFSHDSRHLALNRLDKTVEIWDMATGQLWQTLKGHDGHITSSAFSHDSSLIASASFDNTVMIWDVATGQCQQTLRDFDTVRSVCSVSFSHDLNLLASISFGKTAKIWDIATGHCRLALEGSICFVTFSHDSTLLASASVDRTIKVWNVATGQCLQTLKGHNGFIESLAFSHDSRHLASASVDQTIKVWNVAGGRCRQTLRVHKNVSKISIDPSGQYLHTEIGTITLDMPSAPQIPLTKPHCQGYGLSEDGAWVTWNSENLLWLPHEYRPCGPRSWATAASVVVIGSSTGRILVFNFAAYSLFHTRDGNSWRQAMKTSQIWAK
ncbi:hypothetical protein FALCPG4_016031 [Fusarium falciforme]